MPRSRSAAAAGHEQANRRQPGHEPGSVDQPTVPPAGQDHALMPTMNPSKRSDAMRPKPIVRHAPVKATDDNVAHGWPTIELADYRVGGRLGPCPAATVVPATIQVDPG